MSQSPRTVLPFVQGPELPSGGTLSSISLPEPFPQYVAIMTPFLTKAPLSRLRMMRFSLASHRYPETNSADRTSAPIAPNKSCTSPSALSIPPHDTPHLRGPRKRQSPPGSLSLWVYVTHGPMRRSSKYPSRTPSGTHLYVFPSPIVSPPLSQTPQREDPAGLLRPTPHTTG